MPSPIGHILAGAAVATVAGYRSSQPQDVRLKPEPTYWPPATGHWFLDPLVVTAAFIAAAPDLDLLVRAWHRKGTHSVLATALVMIVTMVVTGQVTGRIQWRWVLTLGAAHASHLLTDWLGQDPSMPAGIQLLWPFRGEFYKSGVDLFPMTERRFGDLGALIRVNLWAFSMEIVLLGPVVWAARRWVRRTRRSRAPISGPAVPPRPSA